MAEFNFKLLAVFVMGITSLIPLTHCGHFLNADGTPHDMHHDLHVPRKPLPYPTYDKIPKTSFTCEGKEWGYHADTEAECQKNGDGDGDGDGDGGTMVNGIMAVFSVGRYEYIAGTLNMVYHLCQGKLVESFLCPNATLFHNQFKACDQFYNVRCGIDFEDL